MTRICIVMIAAALSGCTGQAPLPRDVASAEERLTIDATEVLQIAAVLGYELSGLVTGVPALVGEEPGDDAPSPTPGPGGSEPIGTNGCTEVSFEPEGRLAITVSFDECELSNGELLHGRIAVQLAGVLGGDISVRLDDLAIGDRFITGTMTLNMTGADLRIDADVQYLHEDTNLGIELDGVRMGIRGDGVHFNGAAIIDQGGDRWRAALNDVTWSVRSACRPTDGSIDLTRSGEPPITVLFSASSVVMQVGAEEPKVVPVGC